MPTQINTTSVIPRNDWTEQEVNDLFELPFIDLLLKAQTLHRRVFKANEIQMSTLMSIKTGACPEDCKYCSQSGHYKTDIEKERLVDVDKVIANAKAAKANGSTRFCMGGAWRSPPKKAMPELVKMIQAVKDLGMETCLTAGMLNAEQATELKKAGLDYYNHNLDTSEKYYKEVITTRTYQDRLDTLANVRNANINTCCGGILGLGESDLDRTQFLCELANLPAQPTSVPINLLVPIPGTPLADKTPVDSIDFVKTIAVARIMMPKSFIRLSAGRNTMSEELQALCFMAGANSIFAGEKLLTTPLPGENKDLALLNKLGLSISEYEVDEESNSCCEKVAHG